MPRDTKKLRISSELFYLIAIVVLAVSVCMITAADFGVSMIVAPAYILSLKVDFLTFGQSEYVLQALLFIAFCIVMKKIKLVYFSSFVTCLIYGAVLDFFRAVIPLFNPAITVPGSMAMPVRIVLLICGMLLTSFSVAMFFGTYLYPQVYDFFVKGISARYNLNRRKVKTCFDCSCLAVASAMTLLFFRRFEGVGIATLVIACVNGTIIDFCGKFIARHFELVPTFKKFSEKFDLTK